MTWSWPAWGAGFGLCVGLILGLIGKQGTNLASVMSVGLFMGILIGLIGGIKATQMEKKTKPNQGVWLSGRNALILALLVGLSTEWLSLLQGDPVAGLRASWAVGLLFWTMFGGIAFIEHFELRFILWQKGCIPRDYVRFLDYAAERIFLRKVGGGYIFIHRMLMEYFAALETEPSAKGDK